MRKHPTRKRKKHDKEPKETTLIVESLKFIVSLWQTYNSKSETNQFGISFQHKLFPDLWTLFDLNLG